jgi:succinate dehydrogenase / fumarate reductase iron-sulfur subunit
MKLVMKIQRYDPGRDKKPVFREYPVDAEETDRILDLLLSIKEEQDGSLAFRHSCAHGVCGSDAMIINGEERLACKTLVRDIAKEGDVVTVEPLKNLPVQKDLMVDQSEFFRRYRRVLPFLITDEKPPEKEWVQSVEERAQIDDATKCILCAACYSACPVLREENPRFLGPAQIVQASRFNNDSRDRGFEGRLPVLDEPDGVWPCKSHFRCTQVCPRSIKVTRLINFTKRDIKLYRRERDESIHDAAGGADR